MTDGVRSHDFVNFRYRRVSRLINVRLNICHAKWMNEGNDRTTSATSTNTKTSIGACAFVICHVETYNFHDSSISCTKFHQHIYFFHTHHSFKIYFTHHSLYFDRWWKRSFSPKFSKRWHSAWFSLFPEILRITKLLSASRMPCLFRPEKSVKLHIRLVGLAYCLTVCKAFRFLIPWWCWVVEMTGQSKDGRDMICPW